MPLTYEHVGSKKPAKINTYMLTRAELLITLCYEIPCIIWPLNQNFKLKNQRNWLKKVWMLKFWSAINCFFMHWTKKLTLVMMITTYFSSFFYHDSSNENRYRLFLLRSTHCFASLLKQMYDYCSDYAIFSKNVHKLFCQLISWTNWVNSGKFMDNCWISCQVMADMKKIYEDLITNNL